MDHKEVSLFFLPINNRKSFCMRFFLNSRLVMFTHLYLRISPGLGVVLQLSPVCLMISSKCSFYPGENAKQEVSRDVVMHKSQL